MMFDMMDMEMTVISLATASAVWLNACVFCRTSFTLWWMKTATPSPDCDPRQTGWPCHGKHRAGRERQNQYAVWQACQRCGLRLRYLSKTPHQGETRSVGPPAGMVAQAQEELQQEFNASEVTEKIFQGKLMEIKGRNLVATGRGTMAVNVRADERMGRWMLGEEEEPTCGYQRQMATPKKAAPETPEKGARGSTTPARTPSQEAIPTGAAVVVMPKAKVAPMRVKKEKTDQDKGNDQKAAVVTPILASHICSDSEIEVISSDEEKEKEQPTAAQAE